MTKKNKLTNKQILKNGGQSKARKKKIIKQNKTISYSKQKAKHFEENNMFHQKTYLLDRSW